MPAKLKQVLPYAVMLAVSVWLFWMATKIDADTGGRIGPSAWPKAVIVVMGLLCVYEMVKRLAFGTVSAAKGIVDMEAGPISGGDAENRGQTPILEGESGTADGGENRGLTPMLAAGIGLIALYVVLVPFTGFFLSTALFLFVFPIVGGLRRPMLAGFLAITGSFALVVVFMRIAYISLPLGVGPFRDVSIGLMRLIGV